MSSSKLINAAADLSRRGWTRAPHNISCLLRTISSSMSGPAGRTHIRTTGAVLSSRTARKTPVRRWPRPGEEACAACCSPRQRSWRLRRAVAFWLGHRRGLCMLCFLFLLAIGHVQEQKGVVEIDRDDADWRKLHPEDRNEAALLRASAQPWTGMMTPAWDKKFLSVPARAPRNRAPTSQDRGGVPVCGGAPASHAVQQKRRIPATIKGGTPTGGGRYFK